MINLVLAELLKLRSAPFVRGALLLFLLVPLVFIVLFGVFEPEHGPLRFPQNLGPTSQLCSVVAVVLPPMLLAWCIGQEQTNDTWKLLLVRHPGRVAFYVVKAAVVAAVVAVFFVVTVVVWSVVQDVIGRALGQSSEAAGVVVEQGSVRLLGGLLMGLTASSSALLASVLASKNGGMAGMVAAITVALMQSMLEQGGPRTALFARPCFWLAGQLLGADTREDGVLDPPFAVLAIAGWLVIPATIALVVAARRDVESGNG